MRSAVQSCDPLRKTSTCDSPQVLFSICSSVDVISSTADQVSGRRFRFFSGQRFSEDKRGILGQGGTGIFPVTCVLKRFPRTSPRKTFCPKKTSYVKQSSYCAEPPPRWVVLRTFAGFHSPYFGFSSTMPDGFLRPRHPNPTHHVGGTKRPDEVAPTTRMAGRGHTSFLGTLIFNKL